jgi:hypothetical protein
MHSWKYGAAIHNGFEFYVRLKYTLRWRALILVGVDGFLLEPRSESVNGIEIDREGLARGLRLVLRWFAGTRGGIWITSRYASRGGAGLCISTMRSHRGEPSPSR